MRRKHSIGWSGNTCSLLYVNLGSTPNSFLGFYFCMLSRLHQCIPMVFVCHPFCSSAGHVKGVHSCYLKNKSLNELVFNIAIEPLGIWLRGHDAFKGIICHGRLYKLSHYVGDLVLYISDPIASLPPILSILEQFVCLSGYKFQEFLLIKWLNLFFSLHSPLS